MKAPDAFTYPSEQPRPDEERVGGIQRLNDEQLSERKRAERAGEGLSLAEAQTANLRGKH